MTAQGSLLRWDNPVSGGYRDSAVGWQDVADSLAEHMRKLVEAAKGRVPGLEPFGATEEMPLADVESYTEVLRTSAT